MKYNWQQADWTEFSYDLAELEGLLFESANKAGLYQAHFSHLSHDMQQESIVHFLVSEAIKSSAIESEYLSREDVMSSIRNQLGFSSTPVKDDRAESIGLVMVDAYRSFKEPLSKKKLFQWHSMLFQDLDQDLTKINIGAWRSHKEAMQVISGHIGNIKVHFEAPPSNIVNNEMQKFIKWFNQTAPKEKLEIKASPLRAAIAHLYFETIHPFEDGNGRLGRVVAEKALAQGFGSPIFVSISEEIEANKELYYEELKQAQRSNEITAWIKYFTEVTIASFSRAETQVKFILNKAKFYDQHKEQLSQRQLKLINKMFKIDGFEGGINAKKYMGINKCSKATATRDLANLLEKGILERRPGAGRSTSYDLKL